MEGVLSSGRVIREQIEEGKFGRLYEASMDISHDLHTLQGLLETDTAELLALGSNGRNFIATHHAYDVVKHHYAREIKALLDE